MDEALATLVATLLQLVLQRFAPSHAPTAAEIAPPAVQFVAQEDIALSVCGRPCAVRAYYSPEKGVFLDAELRPQDDLVARSILLHEIVHHVQHHFNRHSELPDCERYRLREREAYNVQNAYLLNNQLFVQMGKGRIDCPGAPLGALPGRQRG